MSPGYFIYYITNNKLISLSLGSGTSESKFIIQSDVENFSNETDGIGPSLPFSCWKCYSTSENDSCFTMNTTEDDALVEQCGQYQQHCKVSTNGIMEYQGTMRHVPKRLLHTDKKVNDKASHKTAIQH